ncbi:MAG: DUF2442 domain-containing protein [Lentisphaeria bacterium]|nr:DUF2442 domain-containing protein [Lentisphaeria bacterium]
MFPKLNKIKALPGCMLWAEFKDGREVVYSVSRLVEVNPVFGDLVRNPELFAQVRIDPGGYGISWNDELDLEAEELWNCGAEVKSSFNLAKNLPSKDSENEPPPRPASAGSQSGSAG